MDFTDLLSDLRRFDQKAITLFVDRYSGLIKTFIRKKVHPNDVDDATQEFLYHVLSINLFEKFAGDGEDGFRSYLVKSALNFSFNWRQKEIRINAPLEIFDSSNPAHVEVFKQADMVHAEFIEKETSRSINRAVALLEENQRRVIEFKLLGYSNIEVARLLDAPLGSVNAWYTRATHALRENLKNLHTPEGIQGIIR